MPHAASMLYSSGAHLCRRKTRTRSPFASSTVAVTGALAKVHGCLVRLSDVVGEAAGAQRRGDMLLSGHGCPRPVAGSGQALSQPDAALVVGCGWCRYETSARLLRHVHGSDGRPRFSGQQRSRSCKGSQHQHENGRDRQLGADSVADSTTPQVGVLVESEQKIRPSVTCPQLQSGMLLPILTGRSIPNFGKQENVVTYVC